MIKNIFPYLNFAGQSKEAANFYAEVLGAEILSMTTFAEGNSGPEAFPLPDGAKDLIMNAQLRLKNGSLLMLSDVFPGMPFQKGNNVSLTLIFDDAAEAKAVFDKLADGGKVQMALQETFWSPLYGSLADKYGIEWQISTDSPA